MLGTPEWECSEWRKIMHMHPSCTFVAAEMAEWKPSLPHFPEMPNNSNNSINSFYLFLNIEVVLIIGGKIRAVPWEAERAICASRRGKRTNPHLPCPLVLNSSSNSTQNSIACDTCGQQAHSHPDWQLRCILTTQHNLACSCEALISATERLQISGTRNLEHAYDRRVAAGMIVLSYSGLRQTGKKKHTYPYLNISKKCSLSFLQKPETMILKKCWFQHIGVIDLLLLTFPCGYCKRSVCLKALRPYWLNPNPHHTEQQSVDRAFWGCTLLFQAAQDLLLVHLITELLKHLMNSVCLFLAHLQQAQSPSARRGWTDFVNLTGGLNQISRI